MASKKFSLLKSNSNQDAKNEEYPDILPLSHENKSIEKNSKYSDSILKSPINTYPILDKTVISFVASHFPEVSKDIVSSLNNLKNTIEKSIDYIEDTSSQLIKKDRNFELSKRYRENTISLYDISISIEDYITWMATQSSDYQKDSKEKVEREKEKAEKDSNLSNKVDTKSDTELIQELNICNDFTDKEPKAFKLDNFNVHVEDWNDLIIKTADLLIKNYKKSKSLYYSNITTPALSSKKSIQNEFRDTIIEILLEYRIDPVKYFIVLK